MKNTEKKDLLIKSLVKKNAPADANSWPCARLCLVACLSCVIG